MSPATGHARTARRLVAAAASLALLLGLAACGDDDDPDEASEDTSPDTTGAPSDTTEAGGDDGGEAAGDGIVIEGFSYNEVTVAAGAEVPVSNEDSAPHTVTADDGAFDSGQVGGGASGSITAPAEPGEYTFHCEVHPDMSGTLTVEA